MHLYIMHLISNLAFLCLSNALLSLCLSNAPVLQSAVLVSNAPVLYFVLHVVCFLFNAFLVVFKNEHHGIPGKSKCPASNQHLCLK